MAMWALLQVYTQAMLTISVNNSSIPYVDRCLVWSPESPRCEWKGLLYIGSGQCSLWSAGRPPLPGAQFSKRDVEA